MAQLSLKIHIKSCLFVQVSVPSLLSELYQNPLFSGQ